MTRQRPAPLRRVAAIAAALLLLLIAAAAAQDVPAHVLRVIDGDTLRVATATAQYTIRLQGIDAPELGQPYGPAAATAARALCDRRDVTLQAQGPDRYGRLIADVVLLDGTSLNARLVESGLAWWYKQYAPRDRKLKWLERAARDLHLGLWADLSPTPPWTFRRNKRLRPAPTPPPPEPTQ
jgi:micrococcal nuclease